MPRQGAAGQPLEHQRTLFENAAYENVSEQALSAYQRAAQVIDTADPSCRLSWTLLAALGDVEARYGAFGPVLNGRNGRITVPDTDGGQIDGNPRFDRAVGPMQLLPSTWSQVAVDADGDGKRDPQDLDDAALGAAVYLCGNDDDLGTRQGKKSAVFRYNHSRPYVLFVLALSHRYALSEQALAPSMAARALTAVSAEDPLATASDPTVTAADVPQGVVVKPKKPGKPAVSAPSATTSASAGSSASDSPSASPSGSPSGSPSPDCPTDTPTTSASPTATPTPVDGCPSPTASPTSSADPSPSATPSASSSSSSSASAATPSDTPTP
ncbi:hypothetical protein D9V37_11120 [Nocardioides mangrovicus]|uniref:Transglycosylase SLT domain-containing protein n=1 Tax=Nocardioides mangrovicus TaxID=2478913 RepID=A0A3L8P2D2_9ACTN|nr:hypothetical protein D9V37_11120 [Nocardioides mangrovicus]